MDVVINCDIILHSIWNGQPDNINEMRQVIKMPNDSSDSPWSDTLTHSLLLKYFLGYNLKKKLQNFFHPFYGLKKIKPSLES